MADSNKSFDRLLGEIENLMFSCVDLTLSAHAYA